MEGNQRLSLGRLAIGVAVLCALIALLGNRGDDRQSDSFTYEPFMGAYFLGSAGLGIVVNVAARPNVAAASSVWMIVASVASYVMASRGVPYLVGELGMGSAVAVAGFVGGTLFAMVAHALVFRRPDPAMSAFVGALTVPAALVFSLEGSLFAQGTLDTLRVFHVAWYLLFALGFGAAAALRGRAVGSHP